MRYKTEKDILDLVGNFEKGTVARDEWGHPEHLVVAYHYCAGHDLETALELMREGIHGLLRSFEVDLTKEMPYHETLTVFWMRTVFAFAQMRRDEPTVETVAELIRLFDKDYPLRFYTRETLFSDRARREFVEADREVSLTL